MLANHFMRNWVCSAILVAPAGFTGSVTMPVMPFLPPALSHRARPTWRKSEKSSATWLHPEGLGQSDLIALVGPPRNPKKRSCMESPALTLFCFFFWWLAQDVWNWFCLCGFRRPGEVRSVWAWRVEPSCWMAQDRRCRGASPMPETVPWWRAVGHSDSSTTLAVIKRGNGKSNPLKKEVLMVPIWVFQ